MGTTTSTASPSAEPTAPRTARPRSRLGHRATLPGGRALAGGFLVGLAVLGTYAAATAATSTPTRPVVVATTDAGPGHRLVAADLRIAATGLDDRLTEALFASPDEVVGGVLLGPIAAGEPLLRSGVIPRPPTGADGPGLREVSFGVERDHAVGGTLQRGDRVDVLATAGSGESARTTVLVRRSVVTGVDPGGKATAGSAGQMLLTLALPDEDAVIAVVHAVETGSVTLVRSTADDGEAGGGTPDQATAGHGTPGPTGTTPRSPAPTPPVADDAAGSATGGDP